MIGNSVYLCVENRRENTANRHIKSSKPPQKRQMDQSGACSIKHTIKRPQLNLVTKYRRSQKRLTETQTNTNVPL